MKVRQQNRKQQELTETPADREAAAGKGSEEKGERGEQLKGPGHHGGITPSTSPGTCSHTSDVQRFQSKQAEELLQE